MKEIVQQTFLYDFYGELLTPKQKMIFEMYYLNDLTLSEIGEECNTTRQAVRDILKRTEKLLLGYEEKLKLLERFMEQKKAIHLVVSILEKMEGMPELPADVKVELIEVKSIAKQTLD